MYGCLLTRGTGDEDERRPGAAQVCMALYDDIASRAGMPDHGRLKFLSFLPVLFLRDNLRDFYESHDG